MGKEIEMTEKDRALFIYLFKILMNQGDNEYDYDNMIKALQYGFVYHYKDAFSCLFDEELSIDDCREVLDILEMYRGIIYSYNKLKKEGKQGTITDEMVRFKGFDGNNETKQMSYATYFIVDLDRYSEIQELSQNYYNSHWQMLPQYRSMLKRWEDFKKLENRYMMNEKQILELLNCR